MMSAHKLSSIVGKLSQASLFEYQPVRCMSYGSRQAGTLSKLIYGRSRKRNNFLPGHSPQALSPANIVTPKRKVPTDAISRRRILLNNMFMRNITELISSDPISDELAPYNLEICSVEVTKFYGTVNVYWTISRSTDHEFVQERLTSIAGKLRSQLIRMQVMGQVPKIEFFKDKQASYMNKLNELYEKADYGEDYVPGKFNTTVKTKFGTEPLDQGEDPLLAMRNDVLGVNHSLIMGRVKQNLAKARKALEKYESNEQNAVGPAKSFKLATSLGEIRDNAVMRTRTREVLLDFLRQKRLAYKELRAINESRYIEPKIEEEDAFTYVEDEDAASNNLCDENDNAFIEDLIYSLTGNTTYQFDDNLEKTSNKPEEQSQHLYAHSSTRHEPNK